MEIVLLWCFVLAWMGKRGAEDLVHAVKGTPNPRYELKKAKARAAGQSVQQPRYGGREWFADLYSDALAAHTEKRRTAAKAKTQPVDDMVDVVREQTPARVRHETPEPPVQPIPQETPRPQPSDDWDAAYQRLQETVQGKLDEWDAQKQADAREAATVNETLAQVIQFPNIKKIEKEISMSNPEATGLTTAIAFADAAADAHQTFSTAGSEGYAGALEQMGFGPGITSLAAEAREASGTATAKWTELSDAMKDFMQGREFYANNPDAPEKAALVNE